MGLRYECRKQIATESKFSCSRISFTKFEVTSLSKSVTIFLDACYTGSSRDNEILLADARPVKIVADELFSFVFCKAAVREEEVAPSPLLLLPKRTLLQNFPMFH